MGPSQESNSTAPPNPTPDSEAQTQPEADEAAEQRRQEAKKASIMKNKHLLVMINSAFSLHNIPRDPLHVDVLNELVNAQDNGHGVLEQILSVAMMDKANFMPGPNELRRSLVESDVTSLVNQMVARQTVTLEAERAKREAEAQLLQAQSNKEAAEKVVHDAQMEEDRLQELLNNGMRNSIGSLTGAGTTPNPNTGEQAGGVQQLNPENTARVAGPALAPVVIMPKSNMTQAQNRNAMGAVEKANLLRE